MPSLKMFQFKYNRTDYIILCIYYCVDIIIDFFDYQKSGNKLIEYLIDIPVSVLCSLSIVTLYIFWVIPQFTKKKNYVSFILIGLGVLIFFGGIRLGAGLWSENESFVNFPGAWEYCLRAISMGSEIASFPMALLIIKKYFEGQKELSETQKRQKENELKLLRSQLDPHFLFNNLNTLDALIDSQPQKAKEYINRLSLIYRYLIQTKDAEIMELEKELELAENYIFLIQTRFGTDYEFSIQKLNDIRDKFIPTGALQTLLENVVKHNKPENGETIAAQITIRAKELEIVNEKAKLRSKTTSFGTGLENLKMRYKMLNDNEINIIETHDSFKVIIPILTLTEA